MELIYRLHTTGDDLEDDIYKMERTENSFWSARMGAEELLIDFYNRFQLLVDAYTSVQQNPPSQAMQALQFISSLDPVRFSEFRGQSKTQVD